MAAPLFKPSATAKTPGSYSSETNFLVFSAAESLLGLPYHYLIQILDHPACRNIPNMPEALRGVIDFRGEAVPYYDSRQKAGYPSLAEEMDALILTLEQRKLDHLNWINKLKQSVYNNEEITVQIDPHQCAFGLWYDRFHSDSASLRSYLAMFDKPHRTIHAIAIRANQLLTDNKKDEAIALIKETENSELNSLLRLFDNLEPKMRQFHYEYAIVLDNHGRKIALSADDVRYFGQVDEIIQPLPPSFAGRSTNFANALGRFREGDETREFLVMDIDKFLEL